MSGPVKHRCKKAIGPDSAVFAKGFTHKTITTTNRSGLSVTKEVLVPLVPTKSLENHESTLSTSWMPSNDCDVTMGEHHDVFNHEDEIPNTPSSKSKVCK